MIGDALRGYLTLASGLTEVTRERATRAARGLVAQGEATRAQAGALAEDLVRNSRANRDMLVALVRQEIERTVRGAGLASAESLDALDQRLRLLERRVAAGDGSGSSGTRPASTKRAAPAKQAAAKHTSGGGR